MGSSGIGTQKEVEIGGGGGGSTNGASNVLGDVTSGTESRERGEKDQAIIRACLQLLVASGPKLTGGCTYFIVPTCVPILSHLVNWFPRCFSALRSQFSMHTHARDDGRT